MNKLTGTIKNIQHAGSIMLVDVDVKGHIFSSLLIESAPSEWIKTGNFVGLIFKETEVSLAKNPEGKISMRNRFASLVLQVERGKLLSVVKMQFKDFPVNSAITTRAVDYLEIEAGDRVEALVKANEISLIKI